MSSKGNAPNSHPVEFDRIWIQAIIEDLGNMKTNNAAMSPQQHDDLLAALIARFERHLSRHKRLDWARVQSRICGTDKVWSLAEMERTGGEPTGVSQDKKLGEFVFMDCAPESPAGRPAQLLKRPPKAGGRPPDAEQPLRLSPAVHAKVCATAQARI